MNDLLSLLLFGALFFLMMRFGCGAHGTHHRKHRTDNDVEGHQH